jgi:hypothetical protein
MADASAPLKDVARPVCAAAAGAGKVRGAEHLRGRVVDAVRAERPSCRPV